jgi:pyruvate/2-oxoglutarate dehydrogenase complex dihydrolipoamide acyltransferase (E2) component
VAERQAEALDKLNQGIRESNYAAQQQTIKLAQDYFDDSTETLRNQIKESRATLEGLPDQILGGREEAFQAMFQELIENYEAIEGCLDEARRNVSNLDPQQIRREGEVNATDAARRDARELGIDITEVEGTGSDGRVTVDDVKNFAEARKDGADGEEPRASEAAKRRAEEMGIDLSRIEGTGSGGLITVNDVMSLAEESNDQATDQVGQAAQGVQETAGQATQQAQDTAGQAAEQVQGVAGQVTDRATGALGGVTDQVGQVTQGVQDTAGQATQQAQEAAGGAVQQAQATAGQAAGQAGQATGEDGAEEPRATNAARRKAEELGVDLSHVQGSGAGGLITLRDVTGS